MKNRYCYAQYWYMLRNEYVEDMEQPCCMACKRKVKFNPSAPVEERWNKAKLERAHVVARSKGGSTDPENIVLLCKHCHKKAPDTIFADMFHRWMRARIQTGFTGLVKRYIKPACEDFDLDIICLFHILNDEDFHHWADEKYAVHFGYRHDVSHLKTDTVVALAKQYSLQYSYTECNMAGSEEALYESIILNFEKLTERVRKKSDVPLVEESPLADIEEQIRNQYMGRPLTTKATRPLHVEVLRVQSTPTHVILYVNNMEDSVEPILDVLTGRIANEFQIPVQISQHTQDLTL